MLAHIADIPALKQAFADGLDIHAMTASEMFGVPVEGMDPMVRRRAKAINFGIIYGISAFQGSAADIIRRAMVRMHDALDDAGSSARMLLQVHDELIFEAEEAEVDKTIEVASRR